MANIENYQTFHRCRKDKAGGGTTLLVHDSLQAELLTSPFIENFESVSALIFFKSKKIVVSEIYRPPNSDNHDFTVNLMHMLESKTKSDYKFICGDFNYDLIKISQHWATADFYSCMLDHEYVAMMLKPTRVTHSTSTLMDNIFVQSKKLMSNASYVLVDGMSDHYPCVVSYNITGVKSDQETVIEKRKLTDSRMLKAQEMLLFHNWTIIYDMSVNESYEYLISVITNALDKIAPKKLIKLRIDEKFREPWMTVKLKKYNNKCRKLCNKAKNSGLKKDHDFYKKYRNTVNKLKLLDKKAHYKEAFNKIGKNSKLLWNVVRGLLKKSHNRHGIVELLYNDKLHRGDKNICNAFNEHFAGAGKRVQETVKNNREVDDETVKISNKLRFKKVTEGRICKLVQQLKDKTSSGLDSISNVLLKRLVSVIKLPLCIIFNKSLFSGVFPDLMKVAKVLPLYKGGEQSIPDNYRPISLLPVISKILERCVYITLLQHLNNNNIVYPKQFGFRPGHSTSDAVMNLLGEALQGFNDGSMIITIFVDLKRHLTQYHINGCLISLN